MRIISGKYKGRLIKMPKGIRPTQNKVRKALFDILGDIKGLSFLELFAGSGAVGIEALSRGVKKAVFAEREKSCCKIIQQNLCYVNQLAGEPVSQFDRQTGKRLDKLTIPQAIPSEVEGQANRQTILNMDSMQAIILLFHKKQKFDIVFIDPPYPKSLAPRTINKLDKQGSGLTPSLQEQPLSKKTLQNLEAYDILSPNGFIIAQHFKKDDLPDTLGVLSLFRRAKYGDTVLSLYRKNIS